VTTPEEVRSLLGHPLSEEAGQDGGMRFSEMVYPEMKLQFTQFMGGSLTLRKLIVRGKKRNIGQGGVVALQSVSELARIGFGGLAGISLLALDLRGQGAVLSEMTFDTQTIWPPTERMPAGFNPAIRLEERKNPGLGIRALHDRGIDGRGVRIAIIDQPLLRDHEEYRDQLAQYEASDVEGIEPLFHASRVAGIAVGRSVGVAPSALLSFYATPAWSLDGLGWAKMLDRIIARNRELPRSERVRVVSISEGRMADGKHAQEWRAAVERATAAGIVVVSCVDDFGTLRLMHGRHPDDPMSYEMGRFSSPTSALFVPAGRRTVAGHVGTKVYEYDAIGGRSWAAPWLAGLVALGAQVAPCTMPEKLKTLLTETAVLTPVGRVVSPAKYIHALEGSCHER
jgi:serine protease AprX